MGRHSGKTTEPGLRIFNLVVVRDKKYDRLDHHDQALTEIINHRITPPTDPNDGPPAECIVFSKDRALQLHALLSSYCENVANPAPIHLLYHPSNNEHSRAYQEVIEMFPETIRTARRDNPFRTTLLETLEAMRSPRLFFLTDDIVVIRPVDLREVANYSTDSFVFSLRHGRQLSHSYVVQLSQPLPRFIDQVGAGSQHLRWRWQDGVLDWNYPLSVDGHVFATAEMQAMARHIEFETPNSFERGLNRFRDIFVGRFGLCYEKSRIVNIPCNRVQTDNQNLSGNIHQDELLKIWASGKQMDYRKLYGIDNISVHQELALEYVERN